MDMDPDTDGDGEEGDEEEGVENGINGFSALTRFLGASPPEPTGHMMDVDECYDSKGQPSDPRRRPPVGHQDSEYAPRSRYVNGVGMS